jgi:outer membrane receptor protein involved in Fe transport
MIAVAAIASSPRIAFADDDDLAAPDGGAADVEAAAAYETVVHGRPAIATDETTALAETIDVGDETRRAGTVSEVLATAVGVDVRSLGGPGSFGAASIRGSASSQVPVYLDGVLLNTGGFDTVDLGALGLDAIDRIEIYRGHVPPTLPEAGIGGAIVLKTKAFERPYTELAATYGSFGTARLLALQANRVGDARGLALVSASGAEGDFVYLDRNGTLHTEADDAFVRRRNNAHLAYEALVKVDGELGPLSWTLADDFGAALQGIPGAESVPARRAELRTMRNAASAAAELEADRNVTVAGSASYLVLTDELRDPLDEVGVGAGRTASRADAVSGGLALGIAATRRHDLALRVDCRYERFAFAEVGGGEVPSPAHRVTSGAVLSDDWTPARRFLVVPALRVEHRWSSFGGGAIPGHADPMPAAESSDVTLQPSLGVRADAGHGVAVRLNLGRYVRAPDLGELYADRGMTVGNPELRPEVAWSGDLGVSWQAENAGALDVGRLELAGFASAVRDLVVYVQNSQSTVRAENVGRAEIAGVEASARALIADLVSLEANYTFLSAFNRTDAPYLEGRRLPGRPAHELYARIELADRFGAFAARLSADVTYSGLTYLDQANLKDAGLGTAIVGLALGVERVPERLELTLEVKNLLDTITVEDSRGRPRPISDFEGYPLPGRTLLATVRWRT